MKELHKSLEFNVELAKSPTRRVRTEQNHLFMLMHAVFKLERLKITHKFNHFSLRYGLYIKTIKSVYNALLTLRAAA